MFGPGFSAEWPGLSLYGTLSSVPHHEEVVSLSVWALGKGTTLKTVC